MKSIKIYLVLMIINNFLCLTRFFKIKRAMLIWCGINVGTNTKIVGPIDFGSSVKISIGDNCWIGKGFSVDGNGDCTIENNVDIAPHVVINTGGHNIGDYYRRAGKGVKTSILIGEGCWIGTRVTIIKNAKIGKGVVVAAGSLVKDDIKDNVMIAGVPAIIKKGI